MNFYIGNSIEEIFVEDDNVEINDELLEFIYKLKDIIPSDLNKFYQIDPYRDAVLNKDEVEGIIELCIFILNKQLLNGYREKEDAINVLDKLIFWGRNAIYHEKGMVSIGD